MKNILILTLIACIVGCGMHKKASIYIKPNYKNICKECKDYLKNELRPQMISCGQGKKVYPRRNDMPLSQCLFDSNKLHKNINCLLGLSKEQVESILGISKITKDLMEKMIAQYGFFCTNCPNDKWPFFLELEYNKRDIVIGWLFNSAPTLMNVKHPCIDCDELLNEIENKHIFNFNNVTNFLIEYRSCFHSKPFRYLPTKLNLVEYDYLGIHPRMLLNVNLKGNLKTIILEFEGENLYDIYELELKNQ